ncbi:MAG TPA: HlyC/CorC family transporter [Desulfarculaceae bacterium]|nr:HlyC/CorC family transporter [Desulfarculaceae bacterium]
MSEKERGVFDRLLGLFQGEQEAPPTEEELFEIINASGETGVIADDTHEMLSSVIQLKQIQVQEVMVPRTEFAAISAAATLNEAITIITDKGFSRYPVFHDNLDQVIGILHAKDILKHLGMDLDRLSLREIMRPVYFVPETKKVSDLLEEFRTKGIHIAVAVDEYGGTSGLVTISDLVEEIIGKIYEENLPVETSEQLIKKLDDGSYLVSGKTEIEDIEELFDIEIEHRGKFESVGGLAVFLSGSIPQTGESFIYKNLSLSVTAADKRRVKKVRLQLMTETDRETCESGSGEKESIPETSAGGPQMEAETPPDQNSPDNR